MLKLNDVNAYYGKLQVLHDFTMEVPKGERVGIFGHNGAGKTTLLKCCVGRVNQLEGEVSYCGRKIQPGRVDQNVRLGIGLVPQEHNVFHELSVEQNLHIAGLLHDPGHCDSIYGIFPILKERRNQLAHSLSGGQRQMLALGMALMTQPDTLLLDEPTTGLAPIVVRDVLDNVRRISTETGTTLIMVEQNVQVALKYVDRAIVIKSGRIVFDGPSVELLEEKSLWHLF